jgi:hypothetical protein
VSSVCNCRDIYAPILFGFFFAPLCVPCWFIDMLWRLICKSPMISYNSSNTLSSNTDISRINSVIRTSSHIYTNDSPIVIQQPSQVTLQIQSPPEDSIHTIETNVTNQTNETNETTEKVVENVYIDM